MLSYMGPIKSNLFKLSAITKNINILKNININK